MDKAKVFINIKLIVHNFILNVQSLTWKRDDSIILVGSWFGNKFADNSRYLYQYLSSQKEKLGLSHVVWVTRNDKVCDTLNSMGYEAYMMNSDESIYFHKHAGWHIICNSYENNPDIEVQYSCGAKKVQLWHGVGMKAVGGASNLKNSDSTRIKIIKKIYHALFDNLIYKGRWKKCSVLATSKLHALLMSKVLEIPNEQVFISAYPRHCDCLKYTADEMKVIDRLKKSKRKVIYFSFI